MEDDRCILFFVKYPEVGQVKQRLAADFGPERAVALYRNFVLDLLDLLAVVGVPFRISFSPAQALDRFRKWLGFSYSFVGQNGADLGERIKNGFREAFEAGYHRVLIIGSDLPDLPLALIREAFSGLAVQGCVIGPAFDGGYYLIGFRADTFVPQVFEGIAWSTEAVFEQTTQILGRAGHEPYVLPTQRDMDTITDVVDLMERNWGTEFQHSRTMKYLKANLGPGTSCL